MTSILTQCYRQPKVYVPLPSKGKYFYEEGFFGSGLSSNGEVPIFAMTAKDELLMKTPDALLNGEANIKIIKSCCPFIEHPENLLTPDSEIIMLGIMEASFGKSLGLSETCPKCGHKVEKEIKISHLLSSQMLKMLEPEYIIEEIINGIKVRFFIRPSTNKVYINSMLSLLENEKMNISIQSSELDDDAKLKKFSESFNKIALHNFNFVVSSVEKIEIINKDKTETETNKDAIHAFIFEEIDRRIADKIEKLTVKINSTGIEKNCTIVCDHKEKKKDGKFIVCGHKWNTEMEFDFTRFFGVGSDS